MTKNYNPNKITKEAIQPSTSQAELDDFKKRAMTSVAHQRHFGDVLRNPDTLIVPKETNNNAHTKAIELETVNSKLGSDTYNPDTRINDQSIDSIPNSTCEALVLPVTPLNNRN